MLFDFFKNNNEKIVGLLDSLQANEIGLLKETIFTDESLEKFKNLPEESQSEILINLAQYKLFFHKLQKSKLNIDSPYLEVLRLACPIFNMYIDFKLLTIEAPVNSIFHAYYLSGRCLFFSPNFLTYVQYDLLTLVMEPWFELFGRLHEDDIDVFMKSTNDFLNLNLKKAVDISTIRPNKIFLEKIPGRPSIDSVGVFYFPVFDENGGFKATLVASHHNNLDG